MIERVFLEQRKVRKGSRKRGTGSVVARLGLGSHEKGQKEWVGWWGRINGDSGKDHKMAE